MVFGARIFMPGMSHIIAEMDFSLESQIIIASVSMLLMLNRAVSPVTTGTTPTHVKLSATANNVIAMIFAMS